LADYGNEMMSMPEDSHSHISGYWFA
jgi:hypothetical protein